MRQKSVIVWSKADVDLNIKDFWIVVSSQDWLKNFSSEMTSKAARNTKERHIVVVAHDLMSVKTIFEEHYLFSH